MRARILDHIDLRVRDLQRAMKFYGKLLPALGFTEGVFKSVVQRRSQRPRPTLAGLIFECSFPCAQPVHEREQRGEREAILPGKAVHPMGRSILRRRQGREDPDPLPRTIS